MASEALPPSCGSSLAFLNAGKKTAFARQSVASRVTEAHLGHSLMSGFIRTIPVGTIVPPWFAIAWVDLTGCEFVCMPIPLALTARPFRNAYLRAQYGRHAIPAVGASKPAQWVNDDDASSAARSSATGCEILTRPESEPRVDCVALFARQLAAGQIDGIVLRPGLTADVDKLYRHWCIRNFSEHDRLGVLLDQLRRAHGMRTVRKRYAFAGQQRGPHSILIPSTSRPRAGDAESAWLGESVELFHRAVEASTGGHE